MYYGLMLFASNFIHFLFPNMSFLYLTWLVSQRIPFEYLRWPCIIKFLKPNFYVFFQLRFPITESRECKNICLLMVLVLYIRYVFLCVNLKYSKNNCNNSTLYSHLWIVHHSFETDERSRSFVECLVMEKHQDLVILVETTLCHQIKMMVFVELLDLGNLFWADIPFGRLREQLCLSLYYRN